MPEDRFLDRAEAADYLTERGLKISKTTLQKLVTVGGGLYTAVSATGPSTCPPTWTPGQNASCPCLATPTSGGRHEYHS
jgi:hypothetical protein